MRSRSVTISILAIVIAAALALAALGVTRNDIKNARSWVVHTSDVKQAIFEARLQLGEERASSGALDALGGAELAPAIRRVCELTGDNERQRRRCLNLVPRVSRSTISVPDAIEIGATLREMGADEEALLSLRRKTIESAESQALLVSVAAIIVAGCAGMFLLWRLNEQISARDLAERATEDEGALLSAVVDGMGDAVLAMRPDRRFIFVNRAARSLLGDHVIDSLASDWREAVEPVWEEGRPMLPDEGPLARALLGQACNNVVYQLRSRSGETRRSVWVSVSSRPVHDRDGKIIAGVIALRDVSSDKQKAVQLEAQSVSDELTGLYNRRGFMKQAGQHLRLHNHAGNSSAVVFIDVNGLKQINDSLGHECGDDAIRNLARVLQSTFPRAILARLGGDEFAALLPDVEQATWPAHERTLQENLQNRSNRLSLYRLSASTGVAFCDPKAPEGLAELLARADREMYEHKRQRQLTSLPILRAAARVDVARS